VCLLDEVRALEAEAEAGAEEGAQDEELRQLAADARRVLLAADEERRRRYG
jgi:hypothetical protein